MEAAAGGTQPQDKSPPDAACVTGGQSVQSHPTALWSLLEALAPPPGQPCFCRWNEEARTGYSVAIRRVLLPVRRLPGRAGLRPGGRQAELEGQARAPGRAHPACWGPTGASASGLWNILDFIFGLQENRAMDSHLAASLALGELDGLPKRRPSSWGRAGAEPAVTEAQTRGRASSWLLSCLQL